MSKRGASCGKKVAIFRVVYVYVWLSVITKEMSSYCIPGAAPSSFAAHGSHDSIFILILQTRKLRLKGFKWLTQGLAAAKW